MELQELINRGNDADKSRWSQTLVTSGVKGSYGYGATIDHTEGTVTLSVYRHTDEPNQFGGIGKMYPHPELDGIVWKYRNHRFKGNGKADSAVMRLIDKVRDKIGLKAGILKVYDRE